MMACTAPLARWPPFPLWGVILVSFCHTPQSSSRTRAVSEMRQKGRSASLEALYWSLKTSVQPIGAWIFHILHYPEARSKQWVPLSSIQQFLIHVAPTLFSLRKSQANSARSAVFCSQMLIDIRLTPFQQPAVAQHFILGLPIYELHNDVLFYVHSSPTVLILGSWWQADISLGATVTFIVSSKNLMTWFSTEIIAFVPPLLHLLPAT